MFTLARVGSKAANKSLSSSSYAADRVPPCPFIDQLTRVVHARLMLSVAGSHFHSQHSRRPVNAPWPWKSIDKLLCRPCKFRLTRATWWHVESGKVHSQHALVKAAEGSIYHCKLWQIEWLEVGYDDSSQVPLTVMT